MLKRRIVSLLIIAALSLCRVGMASATHIEDRMLHIATSYDAATTNDHILNTLYNRIGYSISIEPYAMTIAAGTANSGELDGLAENMDHLSEFYPNLLMVEEPLGSIVFLTFAKEEKAYSLSSWADLSGLRVGTLFQKLYADKHLPADIAEHLQYSSFYEMNRALLRGEVDVIIATQGTGEQLRPLNGVSMKGEIDSMLCYTYLHKRHAALLPLLAQTLKEMKADGTYDAIVSGGQGEARSYRVLHISSYCPEDMWDTEMGIAVSQSLKKVGNIRYFNVCLYSNRFKTDYERAKIGYAAIRTMFVDGAPDLIIASDNYAFSFMKEYGDTLFSNKPVVYCGVSGNASLFKEVQGKYAGVEQRYSARENLEMIQKLFPATEQVLVLTDESATGQAAKEAFTELNGDYGISASVIFNKPGQSFDDMLAELSSLPKNTVVLIGSYVFEPMAAGGPRERMQKLIVEASNVPVFSMSAIGNGEIGGKRSSATTQGEAAVGLALELLAGKSVGEVEAPPLESLSTWMFDAEALMHHSLRQDSLPKEAKIINTMPTMSEANPQAFVLLMLCMVLAFVAAGALLTATLITARKNKKLTEAQKELVSYEELQKVHDELSESSLRLEIALSSANSSVWELDLKTNMIVFDSKMNEFMEFDERSPMPYARYCEYLNKIRVEPEHVGATERIRRLTAESDYNVDTRCVYPNGHEKYFYSQAKTLVDNQGQPLKVVGLLTEVTQRVIAERSAKEISARILNNIDHQVYVSDIETDEVLFINDPMRKALGINDYAGQKCWALFTNYGKHCEHCPKAKLNKDPGATIVWEKEHPILKNTFRHIDKYIQWVDGKRVLLHVMFDISDIRRAEAAVEQQLNQQKLMAEVSASLIQMGHIDAIMQTTLEKIGTFLDCSRIMISTFNEAEQQLEPAYEWISPKASNQTSWGDPRCLEPGVYQYDQFIAKGKRYFLIEDGYHETFANPEQNFLRADMSVILKTGDEIQGVFEVAHEEAHKWQTSEVQMGLLVGNVYAMFLNRQKTAESLVAAKEAAEEANHAKTQFLSTMSHEIRTPMNTITGMTQVILRKNISQEIQEDVLAISDASAHLMSILNDVLDMSKIESGKVVIANAEFDMLHALDEVRSILRQRCEETGIHFIPVFEGLPSQPVVGDKLCIKQVLINLLGNAVKFTPEGGQVRFNVWAKPGRENEMDFVFQVEDNGIGMNEEQIPKLFRPFEQTAQDISAKYGGTGLGLAISQNLVRLMGGNIVVESEPGKGSRFRFALSLPLDQRSLPVERKEALLTGDVTLAGKRILFAEDIDINRVILIELLKDTQLIIEEAVDGQRAVDMYKAAPDSYDMILMDMQMPILNGLDATRQIRAMEKPGSKRVPIIAFTANAFSDDVRACLDAGMDDHIRKPIDYNDVMEKITRHMK